MIKVVKTALPAVVFIMLVTATLLLQLRPSPNAIFLIGTATASSISLLLYAVIRWDEVHAAQQREQRQLADVVDRSMDAILIADPGGRILYANAAAAAGYGTHERGLTAEPLTVLGFEPQQLEDVLTGVLEGQPWKGELAHVASAQDQRVSFVNLFRLEAFQGIAPVVAVIAHDLTRRKALQAELLHSQKLAAVGELAAGLAHEINNPMAAIESQVGLAKDLMLLDARRGPRHEEVMGCVEEAGRQVQRCGHIVESLLRFSRRQQQEVREVDLNEAIEQALIFVGTLPKMRGMELLHDRDGVVVATANLEAVTQILVNLLTNAADATQRQGTVKLTARRDGSGSVAIDVKDNGVGIEPEVLERVFEPFFTTKPPPHGTGLGLSVSYGIARSLGGNLELISLPGGGTVATLTLPAAPKVCLN